MAFSRKKTVPSGYKKVAAYPDFFRSMKKFFSTGRPIDTFRIERSFFWSHISGFSTLASIISLGTFPVIDARNRNTKYAVYDREMNLIDEINNNDSFIIIRAWWLSPNCPGCDRETPEIVYENDIRETQKQVLEIINGIRSKSSQ